MSWETTHRMGGRAARIGLAAGLLVSALVAAPASASPTITREIDIHHDEGTQHFDGNPDCDPNAIPVTEHLVDNEHLVIVDDGTWLNVTFGETFWITVIPDDPSIATTTRKGTDVGHFRAKRNGDTIFHESFHDYGPVPWDQDVVPRIRYITTFTTVNGEVRVDHTITNDIPPEAC